MWLSCVCFLELYLANCCYTPRVGVGSRPFVSKFVRVRRVNAAVDGWMDGRTGPVDEWIDGAFNLVLSLPFSRCRTAAAAASSPSFVIRRSAGRLDKTAPPPSPPPSPRF